MDGGSNTGAVYDRSHHRVSQSGKGPVRQEKDHLYLMTAAGTVILHNVVTFHSWGLLIRVSQLIPK